MCIINTYKGRFLLIAFFFFLTFGLKKLISNL